MRVTKIICDDCQKECAESEALRFHFGRCEGHNQILDVCFSCSEKPLRWLFEGVNKRQRAVEEAQRAVAGG